MSLFFICLLVRHPIAILVVTNGHSIGDFRELDHLIKYIKLMWFFQFFFSLFFFIPLFLLIFIYFNFFSHLLLLLYIFCSFWMIDFFFVHIALFLCLNFES